MPLQFLLLREIFQPDRGRFQVVRHSPLRIDIVEHILDELNLFPNHLGNFLRRRSHGLCPRCTSP